MTDPNLIESLIHELYSALDGPVARRSASINEKGKTLAAVLRRIQVDLPGCVEQTQRGLIVAIAKLAITTRDPEAVAGILAGHHPGAPTEPDSDLDRFHERFPGADTGQVIEIRRGLRSLQAAGELIGIFNALMGR